MSASTAQGLSRRHRWRGGFWPQRVARRVHVLRRPFGLWQDNDTPH